MKKERNKDNGKKEEIKKLEQDRNMSIKPKIFVTKLREPVGENSLTTQYRSKFKPQRFLEQHVGMQLGTTSEVGNKIQLGPKL